MYRYSTFSIYWSVCSSLSPSMGVKGYNDIIAENDGGIVFGNVAGLNTVDQSFVIVPYHKQWLSCYA
jgi:hypothetical protein